MIKAGKSGRENKSVFPSATIKTNKRKEEKTMILVREGKTLKTAKYWKMDNNGRNKRKISYKTACEIEASAVYENRIESYRTLCNNYLCIGRIKD